MDRRTFLGTLAIGLFAAPLVAEAQQPDRVRRLGLLLPYVQSDPQAQARVNAFTGSLNKGQRQLSGFHYGQPTAHRTGPYEHLAVKAELC